MKPIGIVRNNVNFGSRVDWSKVISEIIIEREFENALDGIDDFNFIEIIFYMHKSPKPPSNLKVHPRGRIDLPLIGIFATRSPVRPNPIGVSIVELIKRRNNVLIVRGLDAFNGTPVLDIKPFIPISKWFKYAINNAKYPNWILKILGEGNEHN